MEYCDTSKAVIVVKQKQEISANEKFLGNTQAEYPKKNWSSVILWNCSHPKNKILQTELLNTIHPSFLHQFKWLADDEIGSLPSGYNYLAKTNGKRKSPSQLPSLIHYTDGGPYFEKSKDCEYAKLWLEEFEKTYNRSFSNSDYIS